MTVGAATCELKICSKPERHLVAHICCNTLQSVDHVFLAAYGAGILFPNLCSPFCLAHMWAGKDSVWNRRQHLEKLNHLRVFSFSKKCPMEYDRPLLSLLFSKKNDSYN